MRSWERFIFGFFSYLLFLSCSASAEGEKEAREGAKKMWPDYDKAYVAVFNRTEDQFAPLVDDGKRLAIVEPKDLKVLNPQQLKTLHTLVTGKHAATCRASRGSRLNICENRTVTPSGISLCTRRCTLKTVTPSLNSEGLNTEEVCVSSENR